MTPRGRTRALAEFGPELLAAVTAVTVASLVSRGVHGGFPLDDAWIHMVYGASFARDGTLAYDAGIPSTGCTSPLWALVLGVVHRVTHSAAGAAMGAKLAGLVLHAVVAALAARLARRGAGARRHGLPAAVAAGLLVAALPGLAFAATSGMEVSLAAALLLGATLALASRRLALASSLGTLATTARPEASVLLIVLVSLAFLLAPRAARLRTGLLSLGLALAGPVALGLRNRAVSGRFLPATYYGKTQLGRPLGGALSAALDTLLGLGPWLALFCLLSLVCVYAAARLVPHALGKPRGHFSAGRLAVGGAALAAMGWLAAEGVLIDFQLPKIFYYQRYLLPPLPLLAVGGVCALAWLIRAYRPPRAVVLGVVGGAAAVLALELTALPDARATYAENVAAIDAAQVRIGRFIAETLPPDAVVWSVDAGAVRYFGRRPTLDLMGLNTPELIHDGKAKKAWWPDSVVIVPRLFQVHAPPDLVELVLVAARPDDPLPAARSLDAKALFRCKKAWDGHDPENKIAVSALGRVIAVGRCMRR